MTDYAEYMRELAEGDRHYFCPSCGEESWACGCPADLNTQDLMHCQKCNGQWWRAYGDLSTVCLHRNCRRPGSIVLTAAKYPPNRDVGVRA